MPIERPPRTKAPWPPLNSRPQPHKVTDGETWDTVARKYGISVEKLLLHNFGTTTPEVINWYLREYVGCIMTTFDRKNWVFSIGDYPGKIYLPAVPTAPAAKPTGPKTVRSIPGWSRYEADTGWIWKCANYSDLDYVAINNLAEYGQPVSPYETGFHHDYDPDFANVVVEMTQTEVMTHGYGQTINANSFPVVGKFLSGKIKVPPGTYSFNDLVQRGVVDKKERFISGSLYSFGMGKIQPGAIGADDAAYIHGTVGFALMAGTQFIQSASERKVDAEIGALNDNWDFNSSTVPKWVNATVFALLGPSHYNLEGPIQFRFTGSGKRSKVP